MTSLEELDKRLSKLEHDPWSFWIKAVTVASPIVVAVVGFILQQSIADAKKSIDQANLQVRKMEVTRSFIDDIFSGVPERAFLVEGIAQRLLDDAELSTHISKTIREYYAAQIRAAEATAPSLGSDTIQGSEIENVQSAQISRIIESASSFSEELAADITQRANSETLPRYHIVVSSVSKLDPDTETDAWQKAEALRNDGFPVEVWENDFNAGYLVVTIGQYGYSEGVRLRDEGVRSGKLPNDTYLTKHSKFFFRKIEPIDSLAPR